MHSDGDVGLLNQRQFYACATLVATRYVHSKTMINFAVTISCVTANISQSNDEIIASNSPKDCSVMEGDVMTHIDQPK